MIQRRKNRTLLIVLTLMLAYSIIRYYRIGYTSIDQSGLFLTVMMSFASLFVYCLHKESGPIFKKNFLNITLIVAIGMIIVHFFEYFAWLLGLREDLRGLKVFDRNIVNIAAIASLIGLISFFIGSLSVKESFTSKVSIRMKANMKFLFDVTIFLLVAIFFLSTDPRYFQGGYGKIDQDSRSIFSTLADAMIQGCFLARIVNTSYHSKAHNIKSYILGYSLLFYISSGAYLLGILLSGDRGPIIYMVMMYICGFFIMCNKKIPIKLALLGIIFAAISLTLLSAIRQSGGSMSMKKIEQGISSSQDDYEKVGYFAFADDLTRSYRAYNALFTFGYERGIFYGVGFANQVLGFVPGLRFVVYRVLGVDEETVNTTVIATDLMVAQMGQNTISSATGSGFGTTCFGDVFVNFGLGGIIIIFYIFGYVVKKLNLSIYDNDIPPIIKIFAIGYFAYAIYIGRSTVFSPVKACAYACYIY